jgi:ribose transport system ATP-binding protein
LAQAGILHFENVAKSFGGTQALKGVSFDVNRGEVVALLGENGAGKSTLIKVLGGIVAADSGAVSIDGEPYRHRADARQSVAFVHQDLGLIEWMTVAENMALAQGFPRRGSRIPFAPIDWPSAERRAEQALALIGGRIDPTRRVRSLSRTEKSLVAIARALVVNCDFLVLDEPTASLPADEVERLFEAVRGLRGRGVGMIYVSHRLDEIFRIADRVVVMRDGRLVGEKAVRDTNPDELISLIVGRSTFELFHKSETLPGLARVVVRGLKTPGSGPVDFEIREGELLGLVGLRGAGQEEIGRALFGAMPHEGSILIDGEAPDLSSPRAAVRARVGLLARDRAEESIASALAVRENAYLNPSASGRGLLSFLGRGAEARKATALAPRSAFARMRRNCRLRGSPAAISRKLSWAGGSRQDVGCSSRKTRRPASTSGRKPRSTVSSSARSRRNSRWPWCRPTSRKSLIFAIGRSSSTAVASSPNSRVQNSQPSR